MEEGVAEAAEIINEPILDVLQEELAVHKVEVSMAQFSLARTLNGDMEHQQHCGITVQEGNSVLLLSVQGQFD